MFDQALITKIKQTNISKDRDKTKERIQEIWKSCKKDVKSAVLELADVNDSSYYRIYETGTISAKLAIALAQTVGIDPYYLSGESDEPSAYTEEIGRKFLEDCGYKDLLIEFAKTAPKTRKPRKKKAADVDTVDAPETAETTEIPEEPEINCEMWSAGNEDTYVVKEYELPVVMDELAAEPAKLEEPVAAAVAKPAVNVVGAIVELYNANYASLSFEQMNCINGLSPEDVEVLLKSLYIRSKADNEAAALLKVIKLLLLR